MTELLSRRPLVLLVGGGAAGSLAALHLIGEAPDGIDIVVVEPSERLASGTASSTDDHGHLLNVPASGMSAYPKDPGHFAAWRARTTGTGVDPHEFAPRAEWGRYLAETLHATLASAGPHASLTHVRGSATSVDPTAHGVTVTLDDGTVLHGDALIIGTGLPAPSTAWAPEALKTDDRFVTDPWASGALRRIRDDEDSLPDVLVVGTGLTMVDIATTMTVARTDRVVHAVSRSGRLPRHHADGPLAPAVPDLTEWGHDLDTIVAHTRAHLAESEAMTGDWRPGADGMRHLIQDLWGRLDEADRLRFITEQASAWNRIRHRIPGPSARRIEGLHLSGRLTTTPARVTGAEPLPDGLRVELSDGSVRDVGWVVNATGPDGDVRHLADPLIDDLLRARPDGSLAVCATAGMGFRTRDGRLIGSTGRSDAPVWVLGAARRGELWESTAVPEIRVQAAAAATAVLDTVSRVPLTHGVLR